MSHKFPYRWRLADGYPAKGIEAHGLRVFGTFICGGGSTMGYKLAGFNHLGGVEIDPQVARVYQVNHKPKHLFVEDIRDFVKRDDIPAELYDLDLLDGSPPCSSFSMAGKREKDWGKEKVFREGQAHQRLDDLFFDYIALAKKLQPKVVIAENVKGLIQGNAKVYVKNIKAGFEDAGYDVQLFLFNAASMGVPQRRERVFFVCRRKDLGLPKLSLSFAEPAITFGAINYGSGRPQSREGVYSELLTHRIKSDTCIADISMRVRGTNSGFSTQIIHNEQVFPTIVSSSSYYAYEDAGVIRDKEYVEIGTFPADYNFCDVEPQYLIGMSVPPVMTAQIAHEIYRQLFDTL